MNRKMDNCRIDHQDSRPGMNQIPGRPREYDLGIRNGISTSGNEKQINTTDGGQQKAKSNNSIDQQVYTAAIVETRFAIDYFVINPFTHTHNPIPMNDDVNQRSSDHQQAKPEM
jgi:hypothetical protein